MVCHVKQLVGSNAIRTDESSSRRPWIKIPAPRPKRRHGNSHRRHRRSERPTRRNPHIPLIDRVPKISDKPYPVIEAASKQKTSSLGLNGPEITPDQDKPEIRIPPPLSPEIGPSIWNPTTPSDAPPEKPPHPLPRIRTPSRDPKREDYDNKSSQ
jgi:hypothetical protein